MTKLTFERTNSNDMKSEEKRRAEKSREEQRRTEAEKRTEKEGKGREEKKKLYSRIESGSECFVNIDLFYSVNNVIYIHKFLIS
jgi:Skp family chaperone for outer membrane proteins